jgi:thiol:disulfide interchange protein
MKPKLLLSFVFVLFSFFCLTVPAVAQDAQPAQKPTSARLYDPSRNAEQDILNAQAEAKRTGKNVLVEVGGNWCIWCRYMHDFFVQHADLAALRDKNYVLVDVNFSPENENKDVLSRYPKIPGYPHLFVLDADGKLLHSQNTSELEQGRGYNPDKMKEFLVKWSPGNGDAQKSAAAK